MQIAEHFAVLGLFVVLVVGGILWRWDHKDQKALLDEADLTLDEQIDNNAKLEAVIADLHGKLDECLDQHVTKAVERPLRRRSTHPTA